MKSIWAIGDLQGCCHALDQLLAHPDIAAEPNAQLWFAGDLINRGPCSLATLRRVMALGDRAITVLGNHDLHLLALAAGVVRARKGDTLAEILDAPDAKQLINWLRKRPLAHHRNNHLLVHAGVLPSWTKSQVLDYASEVQAVLRGSNWKKFMHRMYGNEPAAWRDDLTGPDRLRVIVNALTRMRFCSVDGVMEFEGKESASHAPFGFMPWFAVPERKTADTTIIFGHWSTLGLIQRPDLLSLDTGCIWGGQLTAVRLHDRKTVQIECAGLPGIRTPEE